MRIAGVMDERFDRNQVRSLTEGTSGAVVIDLDGVVRITSFGVREWMGFIDDISHRSVYLARTRPSFAAQFNMIAGFGGSAKLVSLYAPYVCNACDHEFDAPIDLREDHETVAQLAAPARSCPKCGEDDTELDDLPDAFFEYVASVPAPKVPPAVSAVIDGKPLKRSALTIRKDVDGELTAIWLTGTAGRGGQLKRLGDGLEGQVLIIDHDIEHVSDAARDALVDLLLEDPDHRRLARVRVPLLAALLAGGRLPRMVSLTFIAGCANCGKPAPRELDPAQLADRDGLLHMACPHCGATALALRDDDLALLNQVPTEHLVDPTAQAQEFLEQHAAPTTDLSRVLSAQRLPQDRAFGRYEVGKKLGLGGMAEVFLGKQVGPEGFEKEVVVKRILPHLVNDEAFVQMFLQEARLAAKLNDAHVVQIFDLGKDEDNYFMVMEYVDGWDLSLVLRLANRLQLRLPIPIAVRIAIGVLAGLEAAHGHVGADGAAAPIIHRDVTPHNVLIAKNGQVKLTDFGVAKAQGTIQTRTGNIKGKVTYMPREQIRGEDVTVRTDIYAAGLVLYTALSGKNPFRRRGETETIYAVMREELPPLRSIRPDVPDALDRVVRRAAAVNAADRYGSATAFRLALEDTMSGLGRNATPQDVGSALAALSEDARRAGLVDDEGGVTPTTQVRTGETTKVATPTDATVLLDDVRTENAPQGES